MHFELSHSICTVTRGIDRGELWGTRTLSTPSTTLTKWSSMSMQWFVLKGPKAAQGQLQLHDLNLLLFCPFYNNGMRQSAYANCLHYHDTLSVSVCYSIRTPLGFHRLIHWHYNDILQSVQLRKVLHQGFYMPESYHTLLKSSKLLNIRIPEWLTW